MGPGVVADTLLGNPLIDWRDDEFSGLANLETPFPFYGEEFVNFNISFRTTPIIPQACDDGPNGLCIEPMFTSFARFDWVREQHWAEGDADWPYSEYSSQNIEDICGAMSQTTFEEGEINVPLGSARTNGRTVGYMSYKSIEDKPAFKADVYWGFDPYRFDPTESKKAISWVLNYFGLEINN